MKKSTKIILIVLGILIALYIIAAHFVIQVALVPSFMEKLDMFSKFTEKGYAEQVYTDDIVAQMQANKSELATWFESVDKTKYAITSDDGYQLIAVAFTQPEDCQSHKWALVLHGYTGWKEEMYTQAMRFFEQGYNVLVPDMRCQGESEGDYIGMGYTDRFDNLLWLEGILKLDPEAEIALFGQSMGASAVIHLSAEICENQPEIRDHIVAAVADSAFCDPIDMFTSKVKDWTGLPCFGLVDTAAVLFKLEGGYSLYDAKAIDAVAKTDIPTLFIQGLDDKIVYPENVDRLYEACQAEKDILKVDGAGHCQSYEKAPEEYYDKVFSFIESQTDMKH